MKFNCTILWAEDEPDDVDLILEAARNLGVDQLIDFGSNGEEVLTSCTGPLLKRHSLSL